MTVLRFDWQRICIRDAIYKDVSAKILNVGSNVDSANLRGTFPSHVRNSDFVMHDDTLDEDLPVDYIFDATEPWPDFEDRFDLVILGDILEHMEPEKAVLTLIEAGKAGDRLCITVPNDDRLGPGWRSDGTRAPEEEWNTTPGSYHVQQVTEDKLRSWLEETKWYIEDFRTVPYVFCDEGYFVLAKRA